MSFTNSLFNNYKAAAEWFMAPLSQTAFAEKGVLTPDEFVLAGDLLVAKTPAWTWKASPDAGRAVPYLPKNKQYLIIKNVTCAQRADSLNVEGLEEDVDDGWTDTHKGHVPAGDGEEVAEISDAAAAAAAAPPAPVDDDDCPDMDTFDDEDNVIQDEAAAPEGAGQNVVASRTYDLTITYDKFFQTPRVWLLGYNEHKQPLTKEETLQDIYADYSNKTATVEAHPFENVPHVSIHPCRHAEMMKRMIDRLNEKAREAMEASGDTVEQPPVMRVDLYLFVFLKFIQAVIPTISYDLSSFDV
eukprot:TRINITY_DN4717_c0_g1_i1.p1 TRINITY_DN4717_c0_g1~~TRINITY_DN4717_c0_g1_i1.p1  ORF type:complete len:300 (+),score=119.92 TRINITY_DN4717_c0_g1_i1:43-942(+)